MIGDSMECLSKYTPQMRLIIRFSELEVAILCKQKVVVNAVLHACLNVAASRSRPCQRAWRRRSHAWVLPRITTATVK
jgi:hypothetical protein